jgi:hypothetical protein
MVNLQEYKNEKFKGVITEVREEPLRVYLETDEKIKAFKKGMSKLPDNVNTPDEIELYKETRLDSTVLVLEVEIKTTEKTYNFSEFFNIPRITGWGRSKLKIVKEKNDLPDKTENWLNKEVTATINKDGYFRLVE